MGKRPALILSSESFNKKILLAMAAPITSRVRGHGFEVPIDVKKIGSSHETVRKNSLTNLKA